MTTEPTTPPREPIPWPDAMELARGMGLHAKQLFVLISTPTAGIGPVFANLEEHVAFQLRLQADGTMFAAGPLSPPDGSVWDGTGMFVYRADSLQAAVAIAEQDPMHSSGARTFEPHVWMLNEGSLTIRVDTGTVV